jgi:ribonuclease P protein subunit RPR2
MRSKQKHSVKDEYKQIALERIHELFKQADIQFHDNEKGLANRYMYLARRLAMKYKVKIQSSLKRQFCKKCLHYLVVGENCRVRITGNVIVYNCKDCGHKNRIGYK